MFSCKWPWCMKHFGKDLVVGGGGGNWWWKVSLLFIWDCNVWEISLTCLWWKKAYRIRKVGQGPLIVSQQNVLKQFSPCLNMPVTSRSSLLPSNLICAFQVAPVPVCVILRNLQHCFTLCSYIYVSYILLALLGCVFFNIHAKLNFSFTTLEYIRILSFRLKSLLFWLIFITI